MKSFPPDRRGPERSNASMARDILALEFQMKRARAAGADALRGADHGGADRATCPPSPPVELARVIGRLRAEAGLDVSAVARGPASITIEFLPRRRLQAVVPQCGLFRGAARVELGAVPRRAAATDRGGPGPRSRRGNRWRSSCLGHLAARGARLPARGACAGDGPLNDLYELSDSVFKRRQLPHGPDRFRHAGAARPLRARAGQRMTRDEVAARLPAVLARLNPRGEFPGGAPLTPTPRE